MRSLSCSYQKVAISMSHDCKLEYGLLSSHEIFLKAHPVAVHAKFEGREIAKPTQLFGQKITKNASFWDFFSKRALQKFVIKWNFKCFERIEKILLAELKNFD